jgi:hypothetical protein
VHKPKRLSVTFRDRKFPCGCTVHVHEKTSHVFRLFDLRLCSHIQAYFHKGIGSNAQNFRIDSAAPQLSKGKDTFKRIQKVTVQQRTVYKLSMSSVILYCLYGALGNY